MRPKAIVFLLFVLAICSQLNAQTSLTKIGEIELPVVGLSATVSPSNPTIPKNTAAAVRVVVSGGTSQLGAKDISNFLGGSFSIQGELSGPGLSGAITLPYVDPEGGSASPIVDPLLLPIPALTEAGDYTLSNLRIVVNGQAILGITPSTVTVKVIDQVLITSVETKPLTLDEIKEKGIVLDSSSYLGFQFTIGVATESDVVNISFPVVFDSKGVPVPQPISPPTVPSRADVPVPSIVPVLFEAVDEQGVVISDPAKLTMPNGTPAPVKIPGVLVIPGDVGYLKQFFSAKLFVGNGAPGGSGLSVRDVLATIKLPAGADGAANTTDDPLTLPNTVNGPQPVTKQIFAPGPGGDLSISKLEPGVLGQSEYVVRGEKEGFFPINFDIHGTLDGLANGAVTIKGAASGGVLVRNPYFDMTFAVPAIVRAQEQFDVFITVKNMSQSLANAVKVTLNAASLSGAVLTSDPSQQIDTLMPGASRTLTFKFRSQITGQVTAKYLHFDTQDGSGGELQFTLGVGERGVPLSPDTLGLPSSVTALPQSVIDAAMRVLGQGWSIANAPAGTLPSGVTRTSKAVVKQKALALAEAGLRIQLGQSTAAAVRDLLYDFSSGNPVDPGFDQLMRTTEAGQNLQRVIGALIAADASYAGPLDFQNTASQILASGPDAISFAVASGSGKAPVNITFVDASGSVAVGFGSASGSPSNAVQGFTQAPLGGSDAAALFGLETTPTAGPYVLNMVGTQTGTIDIAVAMPRGDGTLVRGLLTEVPVSTGLKSRVILDLSIPDHIVLQQDNAGNGSFATEKALALQTIAPTGPNFLGATVIGPETLSGASSFGLHAAFLFDRSVDSSSAKQAANYHVDQNSVVAANSQLSGRIVIANLKAPEGPFVSPTASVSGIPDNKGIIGPSSAHPLRSMLKDIGAIVTGRVFNADGTPVSDAVLTYQQYGAYSDCQEQDIAAVFGTTYLGLAQVQVDGDGQYQLHYVRQDNCGKPFKIASRDPNTGSLRELTNFVRRDGEQITMDIAMFGRGSVRGTIRDLSGNPVPGATVVAISGTDPQVGGRTTSDALGKYEIAGITVGQVTVKAGKGTSLGVGSGTIARAGNAVQVDLTLDGGSASLSGTLQKIDKGIASPIPSWPVVFSLIVQGGDHIPVAVANTAADGSFSFTGVPTGQYIVSAALDTAHGAQVTGTMAANDNLPNRNLTIVVSSSESAALQANVTGTVTMPDGSPASGVAVLSGNRGVLTATDGTFRIEGIDVTPNMLQVISARTLDRSQSGSASVILVPGQTLTGINIALSGLGTVRFTVLDGGGRPVANQTVGLLNNCPYTCGCNPQTADSNGVVEFAKRPIGEVVWVKAISKSYDVATASTTVADGGVVASGVLRFADSSGTVSGTVSGPDGKVMGASVELSSQVFDYDSCSLRNGISQRILTDINGVFRFSGVRLGDVGVTATQSFYPTPAGARGTLTAPGQNLNFDLRLVSTISGVFSGTIYMPDGVTPAGAGVQVTATGPLPDVMVSTDESGHFAFAKIFPEGNYQITAADPVTGGLARTNLYLRAGQDTTHDMRLKGRGTVRVHVVDGSNKPVLNATVKLQETEYPSKTYQGSTTQNNQGVVAFENVFEGPLSASANDTVGRGGRAASVLTGPGASLDLTVQMSATGRVHGHFYMPDGTTLIPNGSVTLTDDGRKIGVVTSQASGDIGAFSFDYVPAGDLRIDAKDPMTARTGVGFGTISVDGQSVTVDVIAQALGTVTGVVTENGTPRAGAHVDIYSGTYHAETYADSTGTYLVNGVPSGKITVAGSIANGFLGGSTTGDLVQDGSTLTVNVALHGSGQIIGQVLQADGVTPAPPTSVTLQVNGGTLSTSTDSLGNFQFDHVPSGVATLNASVLGGIDRAVASVNIEEGGSTKATITLNGVGKVTGTALDSSGAPVAGTISIQGTGAFPYNVIAWSGADGKFATSQVLAGPFSAALSVSSGSYTLHGNAKGAVIAGQNAEIVIQVQPSGTITGRVFRANAVTPANGATVRLDLVNFGTKTIQAQSDGAFTATGVPLGNFSIHVSDPLSTGLAQVLNRSLSGNGEIVDLGDIVLDDTQLAVVSVMPVEGATNVGLNQQISVAFNNVLSTADGISVSDGAKTISMSRALSQDGKTVLLAGALPDSARITVNITSGVHDLYGRALATPTTVSFQTVDVTPARVTGTIPSANAIQVDPALGTITVNFSEPIRDANLSSLVSLTGPTGLVTGTTALTGPSTVVFTLSSALLSNSTYSVAVNGSADLSGNVQSQAYLASFATVDTVAPSLQMTSPAVGAFVNNARPTIRITASDSLTGVVAGTWSWTLDGQQMAAGSSVPLVFTPPSNLADGTHTVTAAIRDVAGNTGTLTTSFSVDTTSPSIPDIAGVAPGQILQGVVSLSATSTDAGSGVAKIDVLVDGNVATTLSAPSFATTFNTASLSEGSHSISGRAIDAVGNVGPTTTPIAVVVDNKPLTVTVTSPASGARFRATTSASVSVSEPVQQVQFVLGSQTLTVTSAPYQATFDVTSMSEGTQTLRATAVNLAGEAATSTVDIVVDRTPPSAPDASKITVGPSYSGFSRISGLPATVEPGATLRITNAAKGISVQIALNPDGSFGAIVAATGGDVLSFVATDQAGNESLPTLSGVRALAASDMAVDASNPLSASLVGLFPMQEASGTGTKNVVTGQMAKFAGASLPTWNVSYPSILFSGGNSLNSYLDAGVDPVFDQLTPGRMTVVAKVWVDRYTNSGFVEKNDGGGDSGFSFGTDGNGRLRLEVLSDGGSKMTVGTWQSVLPAGKWVQVAVTWDGTAGPLASSTRFFVNGAEFGNRDWMYNGSGTIRYANATNRSLRIGNASIDAAGAFNGKMQYVAVYKGRILSGTELQQLDTQLPITDGSVVSASLSPNGRATDVVVPIPGETVKAGFVATQGQQASVHFSGNTLGSVTTTVIGPDGSTLASIQSGSDSFDLSGIAIPITGAYTLTVVPAAPVAGTISIGVQLTGGSGTLRPYGSKVDTSNPLSLNLAGLFLMNEGSGTTTANLVNGSTATFSGGYAPTWNPFEPSIEFKGNGSLNSYLDAGVDPVFDQLTPGRMTVVAKVWVDRYTNGGFVEKNDGGADSGFSFGTDGNGRLRLEVLSDGGSKMTVGTWQSVLPAGKWVQVAVTWDGTAGPTPWSTHFFVNGTEHTNRDWAYNGSGTIRYANATNRPLRIGNASIDAAGAFNGKMQYVAVYKGRILSGTELQQLDAQLPLK